MREPSPKPPKRETQIVLSGVYRQPVLSPKGDLEGLLLEVDGVPMQVVIDPKDEAEMFDGLVLGQTLQLKAAPLEPSPKGEPVHPVFRFHALQTVDGGKPRSSKRATSFKGIVTRLNYAKHGVPNGVVLNTGDFIHMRPRGFGAVGLKIGDAIKATGKATKMARGGAVVEATEVNGVSMDR